MAKCKCDPEEMCEECPEWIFTLADLIMCMMGLFVILWVLKPEGAPAAAGAPDAMTETAASIREAFGYKPDLDSDDPIDLFLIEKAIREGRLSLGPDHAGRVKLENRGTEGTDTETRAIRDGRHSTEGGRVSFAPQSIELTPAMTAELDQIAARFRGHRNLVIVKGHTASDDLPETATLHEKMDLSLRRAQVVTEYLVSQGVEPDIIRVQGCSTYEPVAVRAYTSETRAQNRRVEVTATDLLADDVRQRAGGAVSPQLTDPNSQ